MRLILTNRIIVASAIAIAILLSLEIRTGIAQTVTPISATPIDTAEGDNKETGLPAHKIRLLPAVTAIRKNQKSILGGENLEIQIPPLTDSQDSTRNPQAAPASPEPLKAEFTSPTLQVIDTEPIERIPPANPTLPGSQSSDTTVTPYLHSNFIKPYWSDEIVQPLKESERSQPLEIDQLIWLALRSSPFIESIRIDPEIRSYDINRAAAEFDSNTFSNSILRDNSDPVGNTLTTGGPPRLNEQFIENSIGYRRRNFLGGEFEASQSLDLQDSNSVFFLPGNQANTRLTLRYTQPLLRGAGRSYNRASIAVAEIQSSVSVHETQIQLQQHVLRVINAYWSLVLGRSQCIQAERGLDRLNQLREQLAGRIDLDLQTAQLARTDSEIALLHSRLINFRTAADNAEADLRALVADESISWEMCSEIIPTTPTAITPLPTSKEQAISTATQNRADILSVKDSIRAAKIRLGVANNELKPTLDLVADTYIRGLRGSFNALSAFGDQFSEGRPGFSAGLQYLRPNGNRLAKAIKRQRSLEMQQLLFNLSELMLQTNTDIQKSVNNLYAIENQIRAAENATLASREQVVQLRNRWRVAPALESTSSLLLLDQLIEAELRLVQSESNWASAQVNYMLQIAQYQFDTGTLLSE